MKKKILKMTAILSAVLMLSACGIQGNEKTYPEQPVNSGEVSTGAAVNLCEGKGGNTVETVNPGEKETKALSGASLKLLAEVLRQSGGNENVLLSPTSIQMAIGMTENGASGNTLKQMEETVNGGISCEEMNGIMAYTSDKFQGSEDVSWNVANSVWFKDDGMLQMRDSFLNNVVDYYHSEIYRAPFNQQTLTDINNWVNKETHEMIPEILDDIPDDAYMYLINAIAFEGEWMQKYEEDDIMEDMIFTDIDGSEKKVTMLFSEENRYFRLGGGEGFVKPYEGGEYSFVGILPKEGQSPSEYLENLSVSGEDFSEAVRNASYKEVYAQIPEFDLDYAIELSEAYKAIGMDEPFDEGKADFTDMFDSAAEYRAWIGKILHKTHIEVDRKGTKAAAVTAVELDAVSATPNEPEIHYIFLDRPFVYAIVENETGLPVFIGCLNRME